MLDDMLARRGSTAESSPENTGEGAAPQKRVRVAQEVEVTRDAVRRTEEVASTLRREEVSG